MDVSPSQFLTLGAPRETNTGLSRLLMPMAPENGVGSSGNVTHVPVGLVSACVSSLLVHGEGQEISCPYLHSYSGFAVPQLWSGRNDKHYRGAEVTEGAEPKLLLFSPKWKRWYLSGLVRSQPQRWRTPHAASSRLLSAADSSGPGGFGATRVSQMSCKCARGVMETTLAHR